MTDDLREALDGLQGYNITGPHPELDHRQRLARIARAAHEAELFHEDVRAAVREAMNQHHNDRGEVTPFPAALQEEVLIRLDAMLDYIEWEEEGRP